MSVWADRSGGRSIGRSAKFELILTIRCQCWVDSRSGGRSIGRSTKCGLILTTRYQYWGDRSAKFELILTTRCQYWWVDLPNLNSSWPLDVSTEGVDLLEYLGVDLPNLISSWWLDVSTEEGDLPNLNSSWPLDVSTKEGGPAGRSRGRSAKFELIFTTRCQYQEG